MLSPMATDTGTGWRASLALGFESRSGDTVLTRRAHRGPLVVQKPFYPEGRDTCHVYIVHPPGGVAGGDELEVALDLGESARALVTTPGAAKLYRSAGPEARLLQRFRLGSRAVLEWMPQETIVHAGARAALETAVELAPTARFAGWEIVCLGLPASDRPFSSGWFRQGLVLTRDGRPLFSDRCLFEGGSAMLEAPWGLGGNTVCGLFAATLEREMPPPDPAPEDRACFGVVDGLLLGRYLGPDAWEAKRIFAAAWAAWRESELFRPACAPRIWNT